ncbi:MAG: YcaQ family DNA glycosylase [Caulobacteraceae bacterium]|nr:YcaQ family DNA glycosylase [Caulobacteraceae bacterium]
MSRTLSARQARRIALAAQGLAAARPSGPATRLALRKLAGRLGAIQIDSVNVLVRAHYLPAFSRLGAYPRALLEEEAWGKRPSLFEYWGHEASLLPIDLQPLLRWRMERARRGEMWTGLARFARERRDYVEHVLAEIGRRGPVTGGDFAQGRRQPGWWSWTDGKRALEWLFWAGFIAVRTRRGFERVYDLTERVLPAAVLARPTPSEADAHRALLKLAAGALGAATAGDLRDYFRLPLAETKARLVELVEAGELETGAVEGWRQPAFFAPGAAGARRPAAAALLSPFDNLIWRRERAERLFGTRIRLEIYTPAERREHGYYVLPFLQGEAITARVDLKSDRKAGRLLVRAAHLEPGAEADVVGPALAAELARLAAWLELREVQPPPVGALSALLGREFGAGSPGVA